MNSTCLGKKNIYISIGENREPYSCKKKMDGSNTAWPGLFFSTPSKLACFHSSCSELLSCISPAMPWWNYYVGSILSLRVGFSFGLLSSILFYIFPGPDPLGLGLSSLAATFSPRPTYSGLGSLRAVEWLGVKSHGWGSGPPWSSSLKEVKLSLSPTPHPPPPISDPLAYRGITSQVPTIQSPPHFTATSSPPMKVKQTSATTSSSDTTPPGTRKQRWHKLNSLSPLGPMAGRKEKVNKTLSVLTHKGSPYYFWTPP